MIKKIMVWGACIFIVLGVIGMNLDENEQADGSTQKPTVLYEMTHGG